MQNLARILRSYLLYNAFLLSPSSQRPGSENYKAPSVTDGVGVHDVFT